MIVQANAMKLPLADDSVDCIVTSPPYFALRSYQDGGTHYEGQVGSEPTPQAFLESLWLATEEMVRVLKPSGSIFVNLGDKYAGTGGANGNTGIGFKDADKSTKADTRGGPRNNTKQTSGFVPPKSLMLLPERYRIGCVDRLGLWARQVIIWSKPNGLPESVKDRARRSHEDWVHLTKCKDYFANMDEIREPHAEVSLKRVQTPFHPNGDHPTVTQPEDGDMSRWVNPKGKLPNSVWTIATEPLSVPEHLEVDHFAAFPTEWPRRLILGWCPPEGIVLDPFGGTGTTAMVARALGRTGISIDLSHDYSRLAKWRVYESDHDIKALERTHGFKGDKLKEGRALERGGQGTML